MSWRRTCRRRSRCRRCHRAGWRSRGGCCSGACGNRACFRSLSARSSAGGAGVLRGFSAAPRPLRGTGWLSLTGVRCSWPLPLGAGAAVSRSRTATLVGFVLIPPLVPCVPAVPFWRPAALLGCLIESVFTVPRCGAAVVLRASIVFESRCLSPGLKGVRPIRADSGTRERAVSPRPPACSPLGR